MFFFDRRGFGAVAALLLVAGCHGAKSLPVPAQPGGTCRIDVGEPRSHVLLRCGAPCGTATFADGICADGRKEACENQCDAYQDTEVCYVADQVVSLDRIDREFGRSKWCFWPQPKPMKQRR